MDALGDYPFFLTQIAVHYSGVPPFLSTFWITGGIATIASAIFFLIRPE